VTILQLEPEVIPSCRILLQPQPQPLVLQSFQEFFEAKYHFCPRGPHQGFATYDDRLRIQAMLSRQELAAYIQNAVRHGGALQEALHEAQQFH
jgi:hypothetical protein